MLSESPEVVVRGAVGCVVLVGVLVPSAADGAARCDESVGNVGAGPAVSDDEFGVPRLVVDRVAYLALIGTGALGGGGRPGLRRELTGGDAVGVKLGVELRVAWLVGVGISERLPAGGGGVAEEAAALFKVLAVARVGAGERLLSVTCAVRWAGLFAVDESCVPVDCCCIFVALLGFVIGPLAEVRGVAVWSRLAHSCLTAVASLSWSAWVGGWLVLWSVWSEIAGADAIAVGVSDTSRMAGSLSECKTNGSCLFFNMSSLSLASFNFEPCMNGLTSLFV